jgi:hypothetical protein
MYNPAATDYTSQSFAMPAARGSFTPLALRGSGLLTETGSAVLPNNVPMYQNTWKVPDYLAPARVQAMQADGGGGSSDPFSGGSNHNVIDDPNSYTRGLLASLFSPQAPADVISRDPNTGKVTNTDFGSSYNGREGSINNSMSQSDMINAQEAGMGVTNDGTYCCSRMVDLNLWSEHKQLARMHVWHHKQAKWWRAGYSVWGKVVANTLFKKKGFWTDVMDDFYNYHVKNKPRTLKSTVGDLVIYPGVAVCSLFVQEAPVTTRYVAQ